MGNDYPPNINPSDPSMPWNQIENCPLCDRDYSPESNNICQYCDPLEFAQDLLDRITKFSRDIDRLDEYMEIDGHIINIWLGVIAQVRRVIEELK